MVKLIGTVFFRLRQEFPSWSNRSFLIIGILFSLVISPRVLFALSQSEITTAMGAGWNLGNQLEANKDGTPDEQAWGNPIVTRELIQLVKSAGFKTIRIPVSYLSKIGGAPNYVIDAQWIARVKEVVDYCISEDLYVIINVHGDGYHTIKGGWLLVSENDQSKIKAKFEKVWQQIATAFSSYDEHLIFESMNEVFDGNYYDPDPGLYAHLNAYNQVFIDAVRKTGGNNASRWLLVPGWNTNIDHTAADFGFVMPTDTFRSSSIRSDEKRVMISVHYYSPWDFCGDASGKTTQWGKIATDPSKTVAWCQEDYMEAQLNLMYHRFVADGYPVVLGEWGSVDKTKDDSKNGVAREYFAKTFSSYCKQYGAISVYWDNGHNGDYGFALFDRKSMKITQQGIINAIMSGMSNTAAPGPAPSNTIEPQGPGARISILYTCSETSASAGQIRFSFQVQNDDTKDIPLERVTVRYWYVRDDGKWQSFNCHYAVPGSENITGSMVRIPLSTALEKTDFYSEIGFKSGAGTISPGEKSGEVQISINKFDNSQYNQSNDYSFNPSMADYEKNVNITGYVNGVLVFGTDPFGNGPTTHSLTPVPIPERFTGNGNGQLFVKNFYTNRSSMSIDIMLRKTDHVGISFFNLSGERIGTVFDRMVAPGYHTLHWSTSMIPAGCYLIELRAGKNCIRKRCMVTDR